MNLLEFDALIPLKRSGKVSLKASYICGRPCRTCISFRLHPYTHTRVARPPKNIGSSSYVEVLRRPFHESCMGKWYVYSGDTRALVDMGHSLLGPMKAWRSLKCKALSGRVMVGKIKTNSNDFLDAYVTFWKKIPPRPFKPLNTTLKC